MGISIPFIHLISRGIELVAFSTEYRRATENEIEREKIKLIKV